MKLHIIWLACKSVQDDVIDNVDSIQRDNNYLKVYSIFGLCRKYKLESIIKYHLY